MSNLEDALFLMLHSKVHRRWRVEDIERLIIPPIKLQQCGFLKQDDKAVGFFTFGLFSNESSDGYKNGTRKIQPNDWQSGNNLWIVDFVAPFGHTKEMFRHFEKYDFLHNAKFIRSHSRKKVRAKGKILENVRN